ncbi:MAG: peptidase Ste24p, partial [Nocardioides sp.]|nr:peptidase Ste24p [Nocardioides sp.]
LAGEYPRRGSDAEAGVSEAAKAAARSYSEAFRQSQDAVGKLVHDAAGFLGSARLWLDDVLRRGED